MKKSFEYWKKLHASEQLEQFSNDNDGVLWLKTKSIIRKDILAEFLSKNSIELESTRLEDQFAELFVRLAADPNKSGKILDSFIETKNKQQLASLDEKQLVSDLYKLKSFDWGGDYQNSLDKYLVSRYVKAIQSYDTLISKFDKEIHTAVQGYVLNSWYNHWSSILIEHIFMSHKSVLPTVGQIKYVDFFIDNVPFDLKVTYLPAEFVKAEEKGVRIFLPVDSITAKEMEATAVTAVFPVQETPADQMILDIGPATSHQPFKMPRQWSGTARWGFLKWRLSARERLIWSIMSSLREPFPSSAAGIRMRRCIVRGRRIRLPISRRGAGRFLSCWRGRCCRG